MKRVGKLCLCLVGGLVLNAGLCAAGSVSAGDPYAPIVARNVFDIHSPPPPLDPSQANAEPLPKITPNGITSTLGHVKALFKVSFPPWMGQAGREQTYILDEGQQEDDIEVTSISEKAGIVTFNNHGTVQVLPLVVDTKESSGSASGMSGSRYPMPGFTPGGGGGGSAVGITRFGSRFGQSGGFGGQTPNYDNANNNANNSGSRLGVAMGGGGGYSSPQTQNAMSADDQQVLVTANHAIALGNGDSTAILYPPSKYDAEAGIHSPSQSVPPPQ